MEARLWIYHALAIPSPWVKEDEATSNHLAFHAGMHVEKADA